jgi:hypothetical protein
LIDIYKPQYLLRPRRHEVLRTIGYMLPGFTQVFAVESARMLSYARDVACAKDLAGSLIRPYTILHKYVPCRRLTCTWGRRDKYKPVSVNVY